MLCQFCEEDKPLIEAHIIAKCLLKPLHSPSGPMMHVSKGSWLRENVLEASLARPT